MLRLICVFNDHMSYGEWIHLVSLLPFAVVTQMQIYKQEVIKYVSVSVNCMTSWFLFVYLHNNPLLHSFLPERKTKDSTVSKFFSFRADPFQKGGKTILKALTSLKVYHSTLDKLLFGVFTQLNFEKSNSIKSMG